MKIKNDYIKIKSINNDFTLKNTILNKYLLEMTKNINRNMSDVINPNSQFFYDKILDLPSYIKKCYLKFGTESLEFDETSNLDETSFDLEIEDFNEFNDYIYIQQNSVKIIYKFSVSEALNNLSFNFNDISMYLGESISTIGFANNNGEVLACLDTTNYNIIFNTDLVIERQDTIASDFKINNNLIHLIPCGNVPLYKYSQFDPMGNFIELSTYKGMQGARNSNIYTRLYSIGLGVTENNMQVEITNFNLNFDENNIRYYITSDELINRKGLNSLYPSKNIYPSRNLYPRLGSQQYNYLIFRFKTYYVHGDSNSTHWIEEEVGEYYASKKIMETGLLGLYINVERGE